ncbi:hypothetical protein BpHYR1_038354 [Brachionus plicatilis]|uniref:Uncharacterized protein n=1 Tax=Brachionus plicatilis TaxID=10195 RepID=A0A3M7RED0_BRAPC|nr:hypothetical protein BpHYR1_038354 [Brachionus plicatilis]
MFESKLHKSHKSSAKLEYYLFVEIILNTKLCKDVVLILQKTNSWKISLQQVSNNLLTLLIVFCRLLLSPGTVSSSSYIKFSSGSPRSDG